MNRTTLKSIITEIIRERRSLKEGAERYYISYYATVGEHGEEGTYSDFNTAVKKAMQLTKDEEFMDGLEYVGVEGTHNSTSEFAVIFVTPSYLNKMSDNVFNSPEDAKMFKSVAKKALTSGKPQKGSYTQ